MTSAAASLSATPSAATPSSSTPTSAFACSGSSPTANTRPLSPPSPTSLSSSSSPSFPTLHLLGPGKVGLALLERIGRLPLRLVAVSDSTGTLFDPRGLEPRAIVAFKRRGGSLGRHADGLPISTEDGLALAAAERVVDATPTDLSRAEAAVRRALLTLESGAALALAAKDSLCLAADTILSPIHLPRIGWNAVLGGTGAHLARELAELRGGCSEVEIVGNASTTALIEEVEAGRTWEEGIAAATRRGLLETDPTHDLDGTDAAIKLSIVARTLWGLDRSPADLPKIDLRALNSEVVRARPTRRTTTRLVGRASRDGEFRLAYEEIPRGSHLAVPSDRVVYAYRTGRGLSVHVGAGLGPDGTADALLADLASFDRGRLLSVTTVGGAR